MIQSWPPVRWAADVSMLWWANQASTRSRESGWGATRAFTSSADKWFPYLFVVLLVKIVAYWIEGVLTSRERDR